MDKVWAGEYVDLFKLLHRETVSKEGSKVEERELAKRTKVLTNIDTLIAAFTIFASILFKKAS